MDEYCNCCAARQRVAFPATVQKIQMHCQFLSLAWLHGQMNTRVGQYRVSTAEWTSGSFWVSQSFRRRTCRDFWRQLPLEARMTSEHQWTFQYELISSGIVRCKRLQMQHIEYSRDARCEFRKGLIKTRKLEDNGGSVCTERYDKGDFDDCASHE